MAERYLLFIGRPSGYEVAERDGQPPPVGAEVALEENGGRFVVAKVGASPFPEDARPCVYLQRL